MNRIKTNKIRNTCYYQSNLHCTCICQQDSTPKKTASKGPKPKEYTANDYCRFCNCQLVLKYGNLKQRTYLSNENLFKVPKDSVCSKTLADLCLELGFNLKNSVNVSSRVCKACGQNLRSASKFYKLIETAVGKEIPDVQVVDTKIETDDENVAEDAPVKRQLPTTISLERNRSKTVKIQCTTTRRSLYFKNPEQPEQNKNQGNDNDNVLYVLYLEDLIEKKTSQVKIVIIIPSSKIET